MVIKNKHFGAFVIPHFASRDNEAARSFIEYTIDGLFAQSDPNWRAIIVDDCSTDDKAVGYLKNIQAKYSNKIDVIFLAQNFGPGMAKNFGVIKAFKRNAPFILFNDADDISHQDRFAYTKSLFEAKKNIDLIYSDFIVIDEHNNKKPTSQIPSAIIEIMQHYILENLPEGSNTWVKMATEVGYINKTSATSVRTNLAIKCPFPNVRASEDFHAWMRISAMGANFKYLADIPTLYRIPSYLQLQSSRSFLGNARFNQIKVITDSDALEQSICISIAKNEINLMQLNSIRSQFYHRLAQSMRLQGEGTLAEDLELKARHFTELDSINKVLYE